MNWIDEPIAYRACVVCMHGTGEHAARGCARHCTHPEVVGNRMPIPVETARSTMGPCGIEARFLTLRGVPVGHIAAGVSG